MSYKIILARRVDGMLLKHMEFLARVSVPAAKRFRNEYADLLKQPEEKTFQFLMEKIFNLPAALYCQTLLQSDIRQFFWWKKTLKGSSVNKLTDMLLVYMGRQSIKQTDALPLPFQECFQIFGFRQFLL